MLAKCTSPERGLGGAADEGVSEAVGEVIALLTGEAQLGMVNVKDIGRGMGEGGVHSMTGLADMKEKPTRRMLPKLDGVVYSQRCFSSSSEEIPTLPVCYDLVKEQDT